MKLTTLLGAILILFALVSCGNPNNKSELQESEKKFHLSFDVRSANTMDQEGELDILYSHLGASLSNQEGGLEQLLQNLSIPKKDIRYIWEFTFKVTGIPSLISDATEEELKLVLEEKLAKARALHLAAMPAQIEAVLASKIPSWSLLPESFKAPIRSRALAGATHVLDQSLEKIRRAKEQEISDRISHIHTETTFQEFALGVGKVFEKNTLVYIKVGKFKINNGPSLNGSGQSQLEEYRYSNSRVQRGTGVAPTMAAGLGIVKMLKTKNNKPWSVRADLYFFHDRVSFISGKDYIGTVVSMETEAYEDHRELLTIDSVLLRGLIQSEKIDFYLSLGKYDDVYGFSTGVTLRLSDKNSLFIDYYKGDRLQLKQGLSIFLGRQVSPNLKIYMGYENLEDSYQPTHYDGTKSLHIERIGLSYDISERVQRVIDWLFKRHGAEDKNSWEFELNFSVENVHEYDEPINEGEKGFYTGFRFTKRF